MDIESEPRRFTKEGPFQPIGRRARNPPKKSRDRAAVARDPPDGESATRPRDRTHTRANTHPNAAIKGKIDEVLVKLPEPARKKLEEIEKTTGQPKSLLAGGGALFGLFLVFFLCPPQLVFSAVGVGYPTYASLKMLAEDKTEDAAMWITYWCLFSLLKVVMNPLDFILGFLPFYFYLKLVLLVWLFSPTTKGAGVVYEKVVKPFVFPLLVGSKSD
uniref:Receptor expression-enhancing protein n=1 Tax=Pelagomonas calceolata TaxID=35677 RepID=A0A7S4E9S2_9STRA|mmetsp:Transcript_13506/g.40053  ORF Transcript_13506/g.40053 Transcript_13506/m.40053 type:complete len:216 (-) Transcript_13506:51-698(-)